MGGEGTPAFLLERITDAQASEFLNRMVVSVCCAVCWRAHVCVGLLRTSRSNADSFDTH